MAFFHLAVGHAQIDENGAQLLQIRAGFVGGSQIGRELGDDLHQRDAGAVVVHFTFAAACMSQLTRVFFQMHPADMDALCPAVFQINI